MNIQAGALAYHGIALSRRNFVCSFAFPMGRHGEETPKQLAVGGRVLQQERPESASQ